MLTKDFKDLLRAFNANAVKYLIIGAHSFGVHAEPRTTKDLDLFIRSDEENAKAAFRALAQFGATMQGLPPRILRMAVRSKSGSHRIESTFCKKSTELLLTKPGKTELKVCLMVKFPRA